MELLTYADGLAWRSERGLPRPGRENILAAYPRHSSYGVPVDSGHKTALGRALARECFAGNMVYLSVDDHDIYPSNGSVGLFVALRKGCGDAPDASLEDYPVHLFAPNETECLEYLLTLCLYFYWDVTVLACEKPLCVFLSHHGFLDVFTAADFGETTDLLSTFAPPQA